MCYSVYLSTDSDKDLAEKTSDCVRFERVANDAPAVSLLDYEHKWYVGSKSGCSCTFRHLYSIELGFGEPVEWCGEEEDEIAATLAFIKTVREIIDGGGKVDCIDTWHGAGKDDILQIKVDLDDVKDNQFRFFENHHFRFE